VARRNSLFPRPISPEMIAAGDQITVTYPMDGGIVTTKAGRVAYVNVTAGERVFMTQEGSIIARVRQVRDNSRLKFELIDRHYDQPMLDMMSETGRLEA
jgi:hypothetical protein